VGQNDRQNELQYQDVSTYLRAWYKGKKNDSPIELGSDLGQATPKIKNRNTQWSDAWVVRSVGCLENYNN
jgi:hypothetical protein